MSTRDEQEWVDLVERLATAGARLVKLANGEEVPDRNMFFRTDKGIFCEHTAQQRIRWLLLCEKAIKSMAEQIVSPRTSAEDMVYQILSLPIPKTKKRAATR